MFSGSDKFIINQKVLNFLDTTQKYSLIEDDIFKFNDIGADIIDFISNEQGVTLQDILMFIKANYDVKDAKFENSISDFIKDAMNHNVIQKI